MAEIIQLAPADQDQTIAALIDLLIDSVDHGASVGFLPPLKHEDALAYWQNIFQEMAMGERDLLVVMDGNQVAGSVQLAYVLKPNGRHRAEVQKLLVHTRFRRQGLGHSLMLAVETQARQRKRSLLVLDTVKGDAAEQLYPKLGYWRAGEIPGYARNGNGKLDATVIFYKQLED
jgi:acetyltransferase